MRKLEYNESKTLKHSNLEKLEYNGAYDGKEVRKILKPLVIFRKGRFKLFRERIGFTIKRKQDKVNETLSTGFFTKRSIA